MRNIKDQIKIRLSLKDVTFGSFYWISGLERADKYAFEADKNGCHVWECSLTEWEAGVRDDIFGIPQRQTILVDVILPDGLG